MNRCDQNPGRKDELDYLLDRLDDANLPLPLAVVKPPPKQLLATLETPVKPELPDVVKQEDIKVSYFCILPILSCINYYWSFCSFARGHHYYRWSYYYSYKLS